MKHEAETGLTLYTDICSL